MGLFTSIIVIGIAGGLLFSTYFVANTIIDFVNEDDPYSRQTVSGGVDKLVPPSKVDRLCNKALALYYDEKFEEALIQIDSILERYPNYEYALVLKDGAERRLKVLKDGINLDLNLEYISDYNLMDSPVFDLDNTPIYDLNKIPILDLDKIPVYNLNSMPVYDINSIPKLNTDNIPSFNPK